MSCSKDKSNKYLIDKNLVKQNLELYSPIPSERLIDTINRLTQAAKSTYGVDMGDLYKVRFRDVNVGNYLTMGSASMVTKARLEPNEAAFEAIDKAKAQDTIAQQRQLDERRFEKSSDIKAEYEQIQKQGNFIVSDEGEIQVPSSLPKINVRC